MSENHTSPNLKPHDLITEELVKEALHNDKGENAELLSWEIQDFTNKGDGYMSIVTSIKIKYKKNEEQFNISYVAKLNPLRPKSTISDLTEELFPRETMILSRVIEGMNKQLKKLDLPNIKTPKLYAKILEDGQNGFIAENLRTQGFMLHDKMKGQDLNHALLVVEELGRFHASSLLFEETFAPKTFVETFKYFEESWLDLNSPSFKTFEMMLTSHAEVAIKFLMPIPKYEICVKWLEANTAFLWKNFLQAFKPIKPFDVLIHGDSWTNNMLFRYDEKNNPVEMRFVDLQCTRKASPAADVVYFLYSSLNGDVRSKYFLVLLFAYYQSFSKVLRLANKSVPFTFQEFEEEVENRKIFGLVTALMFQGILFAEGDEIWDFNNFSDDNLSEFTETHKKHFENISEKEGPFKDRFLSVFDDMLQSHVFDTTDINTD